MRLEFPETIFSKDISGDELSKNVLLDGVYFTNDLGFIYSGQMFVLGRGDDVIIVQGRNLYAHQIEAILSEINGVKPGRNVAFGVSEEGLGSDFLVVICEKNHEIGRDERQIKREIRLRLESEIGVVPRTIKIEKQGMASENFEWENKQKGKQEEVSECLKSMLN